MEQTEVVDPRRRREAARAVAEGLRCYGAADLRGAAAALQRALDLHPQHQRAALYMGWVRRCLREQRGTVSASAEGLARVLSKASDRPAAQAPKPADREPPQAPRSADRQTPQAPLPIDKAQGPASGPVPRPLLSFDSEPTRGEGMPLEQARREGSGPHGQSETAQTPRNEGGTAGELLLSADSPGFAGTEAQSPAQPAQQPQELSLVMDLDGMEASGRDEGGEGTVLVEEDEMDLAELVAAAADWGVKLAPPGPAEGRKPAKEPAGKAQSPQIEARSAAVSDREARSTAVSDREARSAAVSDREARSTAATDRGTRSAQVTDREARSAVVKDGPAQGSAAQPAQKDSELSLLPLEILDTLDPHQPAEQARPAERDLSQIFSTMPGGAEAAPARPERRGSEAAQPPRDATQAHRAPRSSQPAPDDRSGGGAQELSQIFSDVPDDGDDDLGVLIDLADHAVQREPAQRAGQAAQSGAPAASGLSMLLSDVPASAEARQSAPQAAASRRAPASWSQRSPRPGLGSSSDLSMLLSDMPLSDEPDRSGTSPLPAESLPPDQQGTSAVSLLLSDEPVRHQEQSASARRSAPHADRGKGPSPARFPGAAEDEEEVLLEEVDLTEELEMDEDHDLDVVLSGDSHDDVFVGSAPKRGGGRPPQASHQSGESPEVHVEISLEGATPTRVPFSGSASFPPPPPSQPDVEQRLREARDALDRRDLDEAFKRAEHVIELLGGEGDPMVLRPYEVRLAEVYERLLQPLDRVPRVGRYPSARMEPQTAFLLSLLDGSMTIEEALTVSGMSRLQGARTMNQLLRRGLIILA